LNRYGSHRLRAVVFAAAVLFAGAARSAEPITIGLGMALTGGIAAGGKSALLGMQIWRDNVNAKGGLMGRPVKLINYDDQSNPATVPGIYTKLLDVDKVDFIVSGYGTNLIAPAMPIAIQHNRLFFGLFGLAVNSHFHYPKYFSMVPTGPDPARAFVAPFFTVVMSQKPKPKTLAIVGADAEYPIAALKGARAVAKADHLKIVYDQTYPPSTADFTPIANAINATDPDAVFVASYPPDSAGMLRAATEVGLKTRFFGGGMVGFQYTTFKQQFGPALNGIIDYDFNNKWVLDLQEIGETRNWMLGTVDAMSPGDMMDFHGPVGMAHKALTKPDKDLATKHIIVISDGDPQPPSPVLLAQLKRDKVTMTTVGVATHGAPQDKTLESMAIAPGKYYKVTDPSKLPEIYIRESRLVSQSFVFDKPFQPIVQYKSGPTARLPDDVPKLNGFVRTTPKPNPLVEIPILTQKFKDDQDYPVLAYWHYGLGKSVAFTSAAGGPKFWSRPWYDAGV